MIPPPNFEKLRAASREAEDLDDEGRLTREEFDRLYALAEAAVGTHTQFLEGMTMRGLQHGFIAD